MTERAPVTRPVNIKLKPWEDDRESFIYVGRKGGGYSGYFGNPYRGRNREELERYRKWFEERMERDPVFHDRVWLECFGEPLGCFCVTKDGRGACHARIIANHLEALVTRCERCNYVVCGPVPVEKTKWWGCRCPEARELVEEIEEIAAPRPTVHVDAGYVSEPEERDDL